MAVRRHLEVPRPALVLVTDSRRPHSRRPEGDEWVDDAVRELPVQMLPQPVHLAGDGEVAHPRRVGYLLVELPALHGRQVIERLGGDRTATAASTTT